MELDDLATLIVLDELAAAPAPVEAAAPPPVELRALLGGEQQAWWDEWAAPGLDALGMLCGRRAGKSTVLAYWLDDGAANGPPDSLCIYYSLTRDHAREVLWEPLKEAAKLIGKPHHVSETHLTIRWPGAGTVKLAGTDTKKEIDKGRGKKVLRAAIDECGAMKPSLIEYLYVDVLEPACMDLGGKVAFAGSPGHAPLGWWWETTRPRQPGETGGIPVRRWTALANPFIDAETYFSRLLAKRGWSREHPTFKREYLGEWVIDPGELVFPVERGRNTCVALPTHTPGGAWLDPSRWRYAIGIDLGYVHASAYSVMAAHPGLARKRFVVRSSKYIGWLTQQHRDHCRALRQEFPAAVFVADTGGYGKPIVEELVRQWGLYIEPAQKTDKPGQIRITRDAVIGGDLALLDGEQNDALRSEWAVMGWDPDDPTRPNPLAEDHASDATLYADRRLHHYVQEDAPPPKTQQQLHDEERARKFAEFARVNRAKKAASMAGRGLR